MSYVLAGAASVLIIVLLIAALSARVREVYIRDSVWASLWARGPWTARPVLTPADAPASLRDFVTWAAPDAAAAETVVEARFTVSENAERFGLGPAGKYLAVVAFASGTVLRWRAAGLVPRTGFIRLAEGRWARREWAFGLLLVGWRTTAADEPPPWEASLLAVAMSACWAPAALLEDSSASWQVSEDGGLSLDLPSLPGRPMITLRLAENGQPIELLLTARIAAERRATMRLSVSDFANFDGYRLPRCVEFVNPDREGDGIVVTLQSLRFSGAWTDRLMSLRS